MIVWLASFPRSGNTFLRILLHRLYGITTSVVYDVDGVARRVGEELVGYTVRSGSYEAMRQSETLHFIKTHRQRDDLVDDADRAICLVRDGRDALVSWARQRSEADRSQYRPILEALIETSSPKGTGSWGRNVLSWVQSPPTHTVQVRYETLIADPDAAAARIVGAVAPRLRLRVDPQIPSFVELQRVDPLFFRRGMVGTHRDELPDDLHSLFWSRPDNRDAMSLLGYTQMPSGLGRSRYST